MVVVVDVKRMFEKRIEKNNLNQSLLKIILVVRGNNYFICFVY